MRFVNLIAVLLAATRCGLSESRAPDSPSPAAAEARPTSDGSADASEECARSSDEAWRALLAGMRAADDAAIARCTTPRGLASLRAGVRQEDEHVVFERWGRGWAAWEVRWRSVTAERATAALGPEAKEHGLVFLRTATGWSLDQGTPGR